MYNPYMYEDERITYPQVGEIILYTVNKGDNVYRLAKTFQSEVQWIKCMNNLDEQMLLQPKQQLFIPIVYQKPKPMPQPQPYQRQAYDLYF